MDEMKLIEELAGKNRQNRRYEENAWITEQTRKGEGYIKYDAAHNFAGEDVKQAVPWLEKAAKKGGCAAQKLLGDLYYYGCKESEMRVSFTKAIYWYRKLAANGHNPFGDYALLQLANCYRNARGKMRDIQKANAMRKALDADNDDRNVFLLTDALEYAIECKQITITAIQRRFAIRYARAARLIWQMEQRGYVSAFDGIRPRKVLITAEQLDKLIKEGE